MLVDLTLIGGYEERRGERQSGSPDGHRVGPL